MGLAIVNLSKEYWESPRRARKHLLFEALLRCHSVKEVLYVDPNQFSFVPRNEAVPVIPGMRVWRRKYLLRGERLSVIRAINRRYIYNKLKKELAHRTVWHTIFYHPWDTPLAKQMLKHGPVLFDWTEDWAEYHDRLSIHHQNAACKMASGVIAVTEKLKSRAIEICGNKQKILFLPNATAWKPGQDLPCPEDIRNIPLPRIGYIGFLGPWFNEDLVVKLAQARPDWHWIMVGNVDQNIAERFRNYQNVHLLGKRPFLSLQAYMANCRVLVAPYRKNLEGDATKLYDYLTLGSPIVCSEIETAYRLLPHVRIATDIQSWLHAIEEAIKEKDASLNRARQEISLHHTWDNRAETLMNWLRELEK